MRADGEDGVGGITTLKDEATDTLIYAPPPQGNFTLHHQPAVRSAFFSYLFFSAKSLVADSSLQSCRAPWSMCCWTSC